MTSSGTAPAFTFTDSTQLRLGHSTFGPSSIALGLGLKLRWEKLRSNHFKTLLDSCLLESDIHAIEFLFDTLEDWTFVSSLCKREHSRLKFPWYQVGSALWFATGGREKTRTVLCKRLLNYYARLLQNADPATKTQFRTTLFEPRESHGKRESKKSDETRDGSILCQLMNHGRKLDMHFGDLAKYNNKIGILIGIDDNGSKRSNDDESDEDDLSEDDESDNDAMDMRKAHADPRKYEGQLRFVEFDTLKDVSVKHGELSPETSDAMEAKLLFMLKTAVQFRVPEAVGFIAALLVDEHFPSAKLLDEVVDTCKQLEEKDFINAAGSIKAAGNSKLANELLVRFILSRKQWPKKSFVTESVLGLPSVQPTISSRFVDITAVRFQPSIENLRNRRIRVKKDGAIKEGRVRSFDSSTASFQVFACDARENFTSMKRQIEAVAIGPTSVLDFAKQADALLVLGTDVCLFGQTGPGLMDDSFEETVSDPQHEESRKSQSHRTSMMPSIERTELFPSPTGTSSSRTSPIPARAANIVDEFRLRTTPTVVPETKKVSIGGSDAVSKESATNGNASGSDKELKGGQLKVSPVESQETKLPTVSPLFKRIDSLDPVSVFRRTPISQTKVKSDEMPSKSNAEADTIPQRDKTPPLQRTGTISSASSSRSKPKSPSPKKAATPTAACAKMTTLNHFFASVPTTKQSVPRSIISSARNTSPGVLDLSKDDSASSDSKRQKTSPLAKVSFPEIIDLTDDN